MRIQIKRDTSTNWTKNNPVLLSGEFGFDTTNYLVKIGDGATKWDDLPYCNYDEFYKQAKAYTDSTIKNLVGNAPDALDTIYELAEALQNNKSLIDSLNDAITNKVDKVSGKGLSTNDFTNDLKNNLTTAYTHSQSAHAPSNAERNIIVGVQKNGADLTVDSSTRKVNVTVPTKTSEITNDSGYLTSSGTISKANQLTNTRKIDGMNFNGTADIHHYAECSTAAATAAKVVILSGFNLVTGARVTVKFTVTNTATSPTLNVNSTGAKAIKYRNGNISAGYLAANRVYEFIYDGTDYELIGDINTDSNTTYTAGAGLTLSDTQFKHSNSVTAGTAKGDDSKTLSFGGTFTIPSVTYDAQGHITAKSTTTMTMPATPTTVSGNAGSATQLQTARNFSITGGATAAAVSFNGTANVSLNVTSLNAAKLTIASSDTLILDGSI